MHVSHELQHTHQHAYTRRQALPVCICDVGYALDTATFLTEASNSGRSILLETVVARFCLPKRMQYHARETSLWED